jgi:hypothetical protein
MAPSIHLEDANRGKGSTAAPPEVEEYDCGCKVCFRLVDYGEAGDELPRKPLMVPDYTPCVRHKGNQDLPPPNARLIALRREHERFLNE